MTFAEFYDKLLFLVSVPRCVCCKQLLDLGERVLCNTCATEYENQKLRECSRCSKKIGECTCSNFYLERHYIRKMVKVYRYNSKRPELPGNCMIYSLKRDNRRDVFNFLAEQLAESIKRAYILDGNEDKYVITNVPRRRPTIRKYGYDHSQVIARKVAKILKIKYLNLFVSSAKRAQKETVGQERMRNPDVDYRRGVDINLKGVTVFLVDDVVTTGASMSTCASLIRGLGSKNIVGATLSIAYKDSYIKPCESYTFF